MADELEPKSIWDRVATPGELLLLMLTQLGPQLEIAIAAGQAILATKGAGTHSANVSALLFSASSAADFLWPSPSRKRTITKAFPRRAEDLRMLLGLSDDEPPTLDAIRNDLTHGDERLEEMYLADLNMKLIAWANGSNPVAKGTIRYMTYDPETETLHSLGRDLNIRELVDLLSEIHRRVAKLFLPLLVKSHTIGGIAPEALSE